MRHELQRGLQRLARYAGIDVSKYHPERTRSAQLVRLLHNTQTNLVFDVGAHVGQYHQLIRSAGFCGRIVSFEPLAKAHAKLVRNAKVDPLWEVAPRMAIGSTKGKTELHVAQNEYSSSIRPVKRAHIEAAPDSTTVGRCQVDIHTLDQVLPEWFRPGDRLFVKIDAQGYEDEILRGAGETLRRAVGVQVEMSPISLYEGQKLFGEIFDDLSTFGFHLHSIFPELYDRSSGRLLQVDGLFCRALTSF